MSMGEEAEKLRANGFRLIPLHWPRWIDDEVSCSCQNPECKSIGKHPLTKHGVTDATTDQNFIHEYWLRWPNANIGLATGGNVDVIDIDGPEGQNVFGNLCGQYGIPQYVGSAKTGREGGLHLYVRGGRANWNGGFAGHPIGLDYKGKGGYVVAPPSLHELGRRYEWVKRFDTEPSGDVPADVWHAAVKAAARYASEDMRIVQPSGGHVSPGLVFAEAVKARIRDDCLKAAPGARWQTFATVGIFDMARAIKGNQCTELEAETMLLDVAGEIGLSGSERARVPLELRKAQAKVTTPIAPRSTLSTQNRQLVPVAVPGDPARPWSADELAAFEESEIDRRSGIIRIEMLARERAQNEVRQGRLSVAPRAELLSLDELLRQPTETTQYRIESLWPVNTRVLLAAQFKAGKTTFVGNVIRCLADSKAFLTKYATARPEGSIGLLDTEMSANMLRSWLRDQVITNTDKIWLSPMRGFSGGFDITDDLVRARWAQHFKDRNTEVVVLDCLGPILAAIGLDESQNKDVGRFINAFEALLTEADVRESLVVHHMGHFGERSRGASRLRDWPDAEWHLIREGQEDENAPAPSVPRFFRAYGRDVHVAEQLLHFDPDSRWLSVNGGGNRGEVRDSHLAGRIVDYVNLNPGASLRQIANAMTGRSEHVRSAIKHLVVAGTLATRDGSRNAVLHYPAGHAYLDKMT